MRFTLPEKDAPTTTAESSTVTFLRGKRRRGFLSESPTADSAPGGGFAHGGDDSRASREDRARLRSVSHATVYRQSMFRVFESNRRRPVDRRSRARTLQSLAPVVLRLWIKCTGSRRWGQERAAHSTHLDDTRAACAEDDRASGELFERNNSSSRSVHRSRALTRARFASRRRRPAAG